MDTYADADTHTHTQERSGKRDAVQPSDGSSHVTACHSTFQIRSDRIRIDQDRKVITVIIQYNTVRFRKFGFEAARAAGKHLYPSRTQWLSLQALEHVLE